MKRPTFDVVAVLLLLPFVVLFLCLAIPFFFVLWFFDGQAKGANRG